MSTSPLRLIHRATRPCGSSPVDNGGAESACGWCHDRWGVSWQIIHRPEPRCGHFTRSAATFRPRFRDSFPSSERVCPNATLSSSNGHHMKRTAAEWHILSKPDFHRSCQQHGRAQPHNGVVHLETRKDETFCALFVVYQPGPRFHPVRQAIDSTCRPSAVRACRVTASQIAFESAASFVAPNILLDELWGHPPHRVSELRKLARPIASAAVRCHPDQTRQKVPSEILINRVFARGWRAVLRVRAS